MENNIGRLILKMTTLGVLSVFVLSLGSCNKYTRPTVDINFTASVDNQDLALYSGSYTNEAGNQYDVRRLLYILTNITLHADDGRKVLLDDIHYIDFENDNTRFLENAVKVPIGKYKAISFTFGLDEQMNISNAYLETEFHSSMAWPDPMGGGYHYMRLEGAYAHSDGSEPFYNTHLGRFQTDNNHFDVSFPIELIATNEGTYLLELNMNINNWYTNPTTYNFENFGSGIMGNQTAQDLLSDNGVDVFSVSVLN